MNNLFLVYHSSNGYFNSEMVEFLTIIYYFFDKLIYIHMLSFNDCVATNTLLFIIHTFIILFNRLFLS